MLLWRVMTHRIWSWCRAAVLGCCAVAASGGCAGDDIEAHPVAAVAAALEAPEGRSVSAGAYHSCAVVGTRVECWGYNGYGQAAGSQTIAYTPQPVPSLDNATAVTVGLFHTCALADTGEVWCWGRNAFGELGDGSGVPHSTPVKVAGIEDASAVSAGAYHTCAIDAGIAKCWGRNNHGQLARGSAGDAATPAPAGYPFWLGFVGLSATDIAAGANHTCAVGRRWADTANRVYCWGQNSDGQLGTGSTAPVTGHSVGQPIALSATPSAVTTGRAHSCAIDAPGAAWCWGDNVYGQLSVGDNDDRHSPARVTFRSCFWGCWEGDLTDVGALDAGDDHTCFEVGGSASCSGRNNYGQLGFEGGGLNQVGIPTFGQVDAISAGMYHTCGWSAAGVLFCAGYNALGQLGNGTNDSSATPSPLLADADGDGVTNDGDACPDVYDPAQTDTDDDGTGDACDACPLDGDNDADADGACGDVDVCPDDYDPAQTDTDGDGDGDACDVCPQDVTNDGDGDGICGDPTHCPSDTDGAFNCEDACPYDPHKTEPGERGCGLEDPDRQVVVAGAPLVLSATGATLVIPAGALTPGTEVALYGTPVASSDFPAGDFPGDIPLTHVYTVTFSDRQAAAHTMTLHVDIPDPLPSAVFGRKHLVGPYGATNAPAGWLPTLGHYDTAAKTYVYSMGATAESISYATLTNASGAAGPPAPTDPAAPVLSVSQHIMDWNTIGWAVVCESSTAACGTSNAEAFAMADRFLTATNTIKDRVGTTGRFASGYVQLVSKATLQQMEANGFVVGYAHPSGYGLGLADDVEPIALAWLVPAGSLDEGGATGVLGTYTDGEIKVSEEVISEDTSAGDSVAHELFHGVQFHEMPGVSAGWLLEATASAAEAACVLVGSDALLAYRRGDWRYWRYPFNKESEDGDPPEAENSEYRLAEYFLFYDSGNLDFLGPLFEHLNTAGQSYLDVEDALAGGFTARFYALIKRRALADRPPLAQRVSRTCRKTGATCDGSDMLWAKSMSAHWFEIRFEGDEPECPPGQHPVVTNTTRQFLLSVGATSEPVFAMIVLDPLAGTLTEVEPNQVHELDTDLFEVWVVNDDVQTVSSRGYSFIGQRDFEFTCEPDCGDGVCGASETYDSCPSDCPCGDGVCDLSIGENVLTCSDDCTVDISCLSGEYWCEDRCISTSNSWCWITPGVEEAYIYGCTLETATPPPCAEPSDHQCVVYEAVDSENPALGGHCTWLGCLGSEYGCPLGPDEPTP